MSIMSFVSMVVTRQAIGNALTIDLLSKDFLCSEKLVKIVFDVLSRERSL